MDEKVGHVMCEVNRGHGGVSNYGETDCEGRQTRVCFCTSVQQRWCTRTCSEAEAETESRQLCTASFRPVQLLTLVHTSVSSLMQLQSNKQIQETAEICHCPI